jgi:hypothetical protein
VRLGVGSISFSFMVRGLWLQEIPQIAIEILKHRHGPVRLLPEPKLANEELQRFVIVAHHERHETKALFQLLPRLRVSDHFSKIWARFGIERSRFASKSAAAVWSAPSVIVRTSKN